MIDVYTHHAIGKKALRRFKFLDFNRISFQLNFSEENIWKLCESWKQNDSTHLKYLYAVFISNEQKKIPIWEQKSASNDEHLAIWVRSFIKSKI